MTFAFLRIPFIIVTFLFGLWAFGFAVFFLTISFMGHSSNTQKTDAIIVLTGGKMRIATGFHLFEAGYAPALLITGVDPESDLQSITKNKNILSDMKKEGVTLGHKARTTIQNALEASEWMTAHGYHSLRLVTSTYHMPRAFLEFRQRLPGSLIIPHPVRPDHFDFASQRSWELTLSEYHKTLFTLLRFLIGTEDYDRALDPLNNL